MPVRRIEKIVGGIVVQSAERSTKTGLYQCHPFGSNTTVETFSTLDEVADYLRKHPRSGVRMKPGFSKVSESIFIDGLPR